MRQSYRRILAVLLALAMVVTGFGPSLSASAANEEAETAASDGGAVVLEMEDLDPSTLGIRKLGELPEEEEPDLSSLEPDTSLTRKVRVSIFLDAPSALEAGYAAQGIGQNPSAAAYRQTLRMQQTAVQAAVEQAVGYPIDVRWNLTLLTNAISCYVYGKDIPMIERMAGVKSVERENQYSVDDGESAQPQTANTSAAMVGAAQAWTAGYTGAGQRIAIIDTGLDTSHQSFDEEAFLHAIDELGGDVELLTTIPSGLNGAGVRVSSKVPYAYNYVDHNTTVTHLNDTEGEHGSHVAGIAAANRYVKVGSDFEDAAQTVHAVGMAPDAQLLIMKVFGANGGANDSDYMAAIEDAIVLGADAANLSLGSGAPGFTFANSYQEIMNNLADGDRNVGMVVSISAGNSSSMAGNLRRDLYVEDAYYHTGGSPGTYVNSLCVASADNTGVTGAPLVFNGDHDAYYTETDSNAARMASIAGDYDYVYIDAYGQAADYAAVDAAVSLSGKVVIINRGGLSFVEKGNNAVAYGPAALIVANNEPGTINMALDDYTGTFPMVSMTQADARTVKAASAAATADGVTYYTGSVKVTATIQHALIGEREQAEISSFSSWGVPGSLLMKPEITAPGGSIYSVFGANRTKAGTVVGGGDQYELMSGTSMAAPHIAGLSAVTAQYLKDSDVLLRNPELNETCTRRAVIQSLLMSTATPMKDQWDLYLPILEQGSGLADVSRAVSASSVIMMNEAGLTTATGSAADGKVKVELGDDPQKAGEYTYSFSVYNVAETDLEFEVRTDLFTQDQYDYDGETYLDTYTLDLPEPEVEISWVAETTAEQHDVDRDGDTDEDDAQAILDYLTGVVDGTQLDLEAGEMDGTDGLSTYDAYLLLNWADETPAGYIVPAGGKADVTVTIRLTDEDKAILNSYPAGAYLEGFTYVTCVTEDEEGVSYEHEHSIPILGFYGCWSDPGMFDTNWLNETLYGNEQVNYSGVSMTNFLTASYNGTTMLFTGNPYMVEDEFPADRLAVNSANAFGSIYYNLFRSAGTTGFAVSKTDAVGGDVTEVISSTVTGYEVTGLWYYTNQATWQNTARKVYSVNRTPASYGLAEGDTFRIGYYAVPEYYGMRLNDDYTSEDAGLLSPSAFKELLVSNELGSGAYVGYDFRVDNTAPTVSSAELAGSTLTITAEDDQNLAYLAVLSLDGTVVYEEMAPGMSDAVASLDASAAIAEAEGYVAVFAADYAGNETAKAVKVNDNGGDIDPLRVTSVTVSPEYLELYKGNEVDLIVEVLPLTAEDRTVTWSSTDTSVVTVNEQGHVVAVAEGTAVVRATSNADPEMYDECQVNVACIDKELKAIIWDEVGRVYFSSFNTNSLPAWTPNHDDDKQLPLMSAFVESPGNLFAATLDTGTGATVMYAVDPATYELEEYGNNFVYATDMAIGASHPVYASYIGFAYTFGPYLVGGQIEPEDDGTGSYWTGLPYALLDFRDYTDGAYLAAVACVQREATWAAYLVLDENGVIWSTSMGYSGTEGFIFTEPEMVAETGIPTSFLYQNLYFDGTCLYWSHRDGDTATLYIIDFSTGSFYEAGNFGADVWPATGIYVDGAVAPAAVDDEVTEIGEAELAALKPVAGRDALMTPDVQARFAAEAVKMGAPVSAPAAEEAAEEVTEAAAEEAVVEEAAEEAAEEVTEAAVEEAVVEEAAEEAEEEAEEAFGSLNAVRGTVSSARRSPVSRAVETDAQTADDGTVSVTVTEDTDVTNGLFTVTYDPEELTYAGTDSGLTYHSVYADETAGTVTFAFADKTALEAGTELAVVKFEISCEDRTVTLAVTERGEDLGLTESAEVTLTGIGHDWGEPTWVWADDYSSATATFVCANNEEHEQTVDATVTSETLDDGSTVYTATVTGPDGETYTDTQTVVPTGRHIIVTDYTKGRAETSIEAETFYEGEVTFTVTCDVAAVVAVDNGDGTLTRLACTTENDEHSFTVTVEDADVNLVLVIKGDANLDGAVNAKDTSLISRAAAGNTTLTEVKALAADANTDGSVDAKDTSRVSQTASGKITLPW